MQSIQAVLLNPPNTLHTYEVTLMEHFQLSFQLQILQWLLVVWLLQGMKVPFYIFSHNLFLFISRDVQCSGTLTSLARNCILDIMPEHVA